MSNQFNDSEFLIFVDSTELKSSIKKLFDRTHFLAKICIVLAGATLCSKSVVMLLSMPPGQGNLISRNRLLMCTWTTKFISVLLEPKSFRARHWNRAESCLCAVPFSLIVDCSPFGTISSSTCIQSDSWDTEITEHWLFLLLQNPNLVLNR